MDQHHDLSGEEANSTLFYPVVYFPLYEGDVGQIGGRTQRREFSDWDPVCCQWHHAPSGSAVGAVSVRIKNSGAVASDDLVVEYDVAYCMQTHHSATLDEVFQHPYRFGTSFGAQAIVLPSLPPGEECEARIDLPEHLITGPLEAHQLDVFDERQLVRNFYLRARVFSLFGPHAYPQTWDFDADPRVTVSKHTPSIVTTISHASYSTV